MNLHDAKNIHFIGIGGIGISAIAKWCLDQGRGVSGSDLQGSPTLEWLQAHGAAITVGEHAAGNVPAKCDFVVQTVAVVETNPELVAAKAKGLFVLTYPQAVNELLAGKQGIAVAGTHGKSTTTALLAHILVEAKRDPTVIVGTKLRLFDGTNERTGRGQDVLVEADEYHQGILLYTPKHAVVLNIDREHVDVYPTLADAQQAFARFVANVPIAGTVTLNADDSSTDQLRKAASATVQTFGLHKADIIASDLQLLSTGSVFRVSGLYNGMVTTQLFGEHNVQNVLAALAVAHKLGTPFETAQRAILAFPGTWRRFENRGTWKGATIIDDYAHHPTELAATLQAARQAFPGRRLIAVFQPHLHSRTKAFFNDFANVLRQADLCIVVEVYEPAGREAGGVESASVLAQAVGPTAKFAATVADAVTTLAPDVQPGDVVLTLGAGDITGFAKLAQKKDPEL